MEAPLYCWIVNTKQARDVWNTHSSGIQDSIRGDSFSDDGAERPVTSLPIPVSSARCSMRSLGVVKARGPACLWLRQICEATSGISGAYHLSQQQKNFLEVVNLKGSRGVEIKIRGKELGSFGRWHCAIRGSIYRLFAERLDQSCLKECDEEFERQKTSSRHRWRTFSNLIVCSNFETSSADWLIRKDRPPRHGGVPHEHEGEYEQRRGAGSSKIINE